MQESAAKAFKAYGRPLETVTSFKYLGRVLAALDDYWLTVVRNLRNSWKSWSLLLIIMGTEVASPILSGMLFQVVVQAALIFGLETWVMNPRMCQSLGWVPILVHLTSHGES